MQEYQAVTTGLCREPRVWLVTGAAGFIGSNLVETLLRLNQRVVGLDNFATGFESNLQEVRTTVGSARWNNYLHIQGDTRDLETCRRAVAGVDFVLHQAALGSVPRSLAHPLESHSANVTGFINMLVAARDAPAKRFVYASSSSVYGDYPGLPKVEHQIGRCLSPYAATKLANEIYADVFSRSYGLETIGLRYFNVFGPRQDPDGPYAAVIPRWIAAMSRNEPVWINGDGQTSRDFCYVANVVQANLLAATTQNPPAVNQVYNVALNARTTLNELFGLLRDNLAVFYPHLAHLQGQHRDGRQGDVRHSQADISKAQALLGYEPSHDLEGGLMETLEWHLERVLACSKRNCLEPVTVQGPSQNPNLGAG